MHLLVSKPIIAYLISSLPNCLNRDAPVETISTHRCLRIFGRFAY